MFAERFSRGGSLARRLQGGYVADAMYEFDRDRYVTPAGSGSFQGNVSPLWNVGPVPNGGYVLSLAMAALEQTFAGLDPLTVTAHFLRPTAPGPIEAAVETIKRGRNFSTAMVALRQDGKESVRVLATYGRLDAVEAEREFVDGTPPAVARDDCLLWNRPKGMAPEIANRFESRIASEDAKRMQTGDADRAEVRGWIRFVDGRAADVGLAQLHLPDPLLVRRAAGGGRRDLGRQRTAGCAVAAAGRSAAHHLR